MPSKIETLQRNHHNTPLNDNKLDIVVVCDGLQSPANVGSLFRICEAFGVSQITFTKTKIDFNSSRLKRTSRGTDQKVPYEFTDNIITSLKEYENLGYEILGLEITRDSKPLTSFKNSNHSKLVWIIGHESTGVSEEVLAIFKNHYHIEMFGSNSSINVIQALGMALFQVTNR